MSSKEHIVQHLLVQKQSNEKHVCLYVSSLPLMLWGEWEPSQRERYPTTKYHNYKLTHEAYTKDS